MDMLGETIVQRVFLELTIMYCILTRNWALNKQGKDSLVLNFTGPTILLDYSHLFQHVLAFLVLLRIVRGRYLQTTR